MRNVGCLRCLCTREREWLYVRKESSVRGGVLWFRAGPAHLVRRKRPTRIGRVQNLLEVRTCSRGCDGECDGRVSVTGARGVPGLRVRCPADVIDSIETTGAPPGCWASNHARVSPLHLSSASHRLTAYISAACDFQGSISLNPNMTEQLPKAALYYFPASVWCAPREWRRVVF